MATHKGRRPKTNKHMGYKRPCFSEMWKRLWADPEWRAKAKERNRTGVPHGYTKATIAPLRAQAAQRANEIIMELEKKGIVDAVVIPDSDEALAKEAIRAAATIALTPGGQRDRLVALNLVLQYTKAKPVTKTELAVKSPEAWLEEALAASKASND